MGELLDELQSIVGRRYSDARKRQKERYNLARSFGFTGAESAVMQNWNEQKILACAKEHHQPHCVKPENDH